MNGHLTEQQLIDHQFKLASEAGMGEARAHLEQCESCRQRLAELTRKFAALDLLREEVRPSDALIARTVENAAKARHARVIPFLSMPWLGAIAAAIIVGVALLVAPNLGPQGQPKGTQAPTDARRVGLAPPEPAGKDHRQAALDDATRSLQLGGIDEKPPFAPASAIELVVLPRRENVQLTIYNSADLTLVRERRNLTLKQGWNWLQFMWANTLIDPTSLTLEPLEHKGEVEVQQWVFPPRLR